MRIHETVLPELERAGYITLGAAIIAWGRLQVMRSKLEPEVSRITSGLSSILKFPRP